MHFFSRVVAESTDECEYVHDVVNLIWSFGPSTARRRHYRQGAEWQAVTEKTLFAEIDRVQLKHHVMDALYSMQQHEAETM